MPKNTFYDVLQLSPNADPMVIEAAYRSLAQRYHPDNNSGNSDAEKHLKIINRAYEVLSDPVKREGYDAALMDADESQDIQPDAATSTMEVTSAPEVIPSKENASSSVPARHNLKKEEPNETADDSVQESGGGILGLYKAAIGEKNTSYYTKKFEQFDRQGAGFHASFNTPAFFFPGLWALYRKMYGWFFVMLGITSIAYFMALAFMLGTGAKTISGFFYIYGAPHLLFAMFADSIYQRHVRKNIAAAQLALRHEPELLAHLRVKGGVNGWVRWLGLVPIIGILVAIIVPAYNDSQQRVSGQQSQQPAPGSEKDPLGLYRGASPQNQQPATGGYGPNDTLVDGASPQSQNPALLYQPTGRDLLAEEPGRDWLAEEPGRDWLAEEPTAQPKK